MKNVMFAVLLVMGGLFAAEPEAPQVKAPEKAEPTEKQKVAVREIHPDTGAPIYDVDEPKPVGVNYHLRERDGSFVGGGAAVSSCASGNCWIRVDGRAAGKSLAVKSITIKEPTCATGRCPLPARYEVATSTCASGQCKGETKAVVVKETAKETVRQYDGEYPIYDEWEEKPVGVWYEIRQRSSSTGPTKPYPSVISLKTGGG